MAAQNHLSRGVLSLQKVLQRAVREKSVFPPQGWLQEEKISNPAKCRARTHIFHHYNHLQFQHPFIASTSVSLRLSENLPVGPSLLFCSGSVFAHKSGEFPGH